MADDVDVALRPCAAEVRGVTASHGQWTVMLAKPTQRLPMEPIHEDLELGGLNADQAIQLAESAGKLVVVHIRILSPDEIPF